MTLDQLTAWLSKHEITDIDCIVPDIAGAARGKSTTTALFLDGIKNNSLRVPEAMYAISTQGEVVFSDLVKSTEQDLVLLPDLNTLHLAPWKNTPTACVLCDSVYDGGAENDLSSRQILKTVLKLYDAKGWKPLIGPEIEFYLVDKIEDGLANPRPPKGRSGQRELGQHVYSLDALDDFGAFFEDIYKFSKQQNIDLETLIHEDGPSQFEVNIHYDNALDVADQAFLFKRLARLMAIRHDMFACFMAKPYGKESGSSMHMHQSVINTKSGDNIFSKKDGSDSPLFMNYIGGLQKYLPEIMPLFAPYANSYRRFEAHMSAPTNTNWGQENRTVGLRVPTTSAMARRVENRIAGSDVNPYLAIAATLLCGYIGMVDKVEPRPETKGEAYDQSDHALPKTIDIALDNFINSKVMNKYLGEKFVSTFAKIKQVENEHRARFLNPWDVRYLMVNV